MPLPEMINIHRYQMKFGNTTVIHDLSFTVHAGETFAFLGSNGSGKTTTIRTLLGIFEPTAGSLQIEGRRYQPSMGRMLGYLPEERGLYKKESVIDTMLYFGRLKGMPALEARQWSLNYLERVGLGDKARVAVEKLSGGQQQKIQLGVTIMNDPRLMILDEPTKGFDPVNRRLLMEIVEEHHNRGATVVLVTHQMEEVERLCDRVLLLKDGRSRLYGTVDDIKNQHGIPVIDLDYRGTLRLSGKTYHVKQFGKRSAELAIKPGHNPQAVLRELVDSAGLSLTKFVLRQSSLDDIFVTIYNEATPDVSGQPA